jgi:acyl dehydratase
MEKRESKSRADAGIVVFKHVCFNQKNEIVSTCLRSALMYKKGLGK